jgi:hypothetical protein
LTFQQRSSVAKRRRGQATGMDLDPIDIDPDHDHVGVGEPRRKLSIQPTPPQGSHFRDILDDRGAATEGDVALSRGMLKRQRDQGRSAHLRHFARTSADKESPCPFIGSG